MNAPRIRAATGRPLLPALLPVLVLLCALGIAAVGRAPAFPRAFLYAFGIAAVLRLTLGRDGRRLLPRRALVALGVALSASSVAFLFDRLARGSAESLTALLAVVSVFQGLCLLSRQTTFGAFLLILLSSVHAAGASIENKDTAALVFILAYVVVLAWTLLLFERRIALEREPGPEGATRRVRAPGAEALPPAPAFRAIAALVLVGFPLGTLLYLAAPRHWKLFEGDLVRTDRETADTAADVETDAPAPFESRGGAVVVSGPGKGVPFGSVAEIKKDITAWFEVWEEIEGRPSRLREVVLRDNVHDLYDEDENVWRDTLARPTREYRYRDVDDGRRDGWIPLGHRGPAGQGTRTLRIEHKVGGQRRLYLQPIPTRVQLVRHGRAQSGFEVTESANKTYAVGFALEAGDQILERFVPQQTSDAVLEGRRSDSSVSPSPSYLDVPPRCGGPLGRRARSVVGEARDPWRRARRLERWLRSEAFTYTLKLPPLDPRNPIVDFVENTRSGNCEGFAIALTLMLRTLGHPTRYVRGFWGGDVQEARGSVILRGYHYHAWTEMYLDGIGWVPLNPTPPDRRPADADTFTVAAGGGTDGDEDDSFAFLGYDAAQWDRLWARIGDGFEAVVVDPLRLLFGPRGAYIGVPLGVLVLLVLVRRRRTERVRRLVVAAGRSLPPGPYGRALMLLARRGMRRRPSQTPRAFGRVAAERFPTAAPALATLTRVHERERYGGGASPDARRAASSALRTLKDALRKRS